MNGIHDMGGMAGMGEILYEQDEPVFHARWESRVFALNRAMRAWQKSNIDVFRRDIEQLPAGDYLQLSYYERWLAALEKEVVADGFLTAEELRNGKAVGDSKQATPALPLEFAREVDRGIPSSADPSIPALFAAGQQVRTRNMHPSGHTRLPRYARGRSGEIARDHGVYTFPDTSAHHQGEKRQHVYSVRFAARELWGPQAAARDSVYLDLWDDYLEPA